MGCNGNDGQDCWAVRGRSICLAHREVESDLLINLCALSLMTSETPSSVARSLSAARPTNALCRLVKNGEVFWIPVQMRKLPNRDNLPACSLMSAFGPKQTWACAPFCIAHVRFWPEADGHLTRTTPRWHKSARELCSIDQGHHSRDVQIEGAFHATRISRRIHRHLYASQRRLRCCVVFRAISWSATLSTRDCSELAIWRGCSHTLRLSHADVLIEGVRRRDIETEGTIKEDKVSLLTDVRVINSE